MKYLMIENDGEVDVMALTLMGASSKRGQDGKIGFFGSGNKYAIANMLRRGIGFRICSGKEHIETSVKKVTFREKEFGKIQFTFKGEVHETSITTDMGPKWEPWYILRELYCNALDEGGMRMQVVGPDQDHYILLTGAEGKTRIYIELVEELVHVVNHWNAYFTRDRLDLIEEITGKEVMMFEHTHDLKLYHKYDDKLRIYRKGVLVYTGEEKSIFDYDLPSAEINEERILANIYQAKLKISESMAGGGSASLITKLMKGMDKYHREGLAHFENGMDMARMIKVNEVSWGEAIKGFTVINDDRKETYTEEAKENNTLMLGSNLAYAVSHIEGSRVLGVPTKGMAHSFKETNPTMEQRQLLDKAFEYLVACGSFDFGDIKIHTCNFDDYSVCAMADVPGNKIFVGQACFDKGLKFMVVTLMEEHSHIVSRMGDMTRAFQNFIFDKWLCEIEERTGIRL